MNHFEPAGFGVLFLDLALMLGFARLLGGLTRKFHLPAVVGEILAGIILGRTVLGSIAPGIFATLFPDSGFIALALQTMIALAVVLLLLVAGMEIDLFGLKRQGRALLAILPCNILIPSALGFALGWFYHQPWSGPTAVSRPLFALFSATAMFIVAMPVIAKILMELDLLKTALGSLIISIAMLNDLIGWLVFSVVLSLVAGQAAHRWGVLWILVMVPVLIFLFMTLGKLLIARLIHFVHRNSPGPGGIMTLVLVLAFLGAALAEFIGINLIFGSLLVGLVIGNLSPVQERIAGNIGQFVMNIFAPLFFASIGLQVNFITNFDPGMVIIVLVVACGGTLAGTLLGGRLGKLDYGSSWIVALGVNARGTMEIILGLLALEYGIINQKFFVALVVMALVTSILSGPLIQLLRARQAGAKPAESSAGSG